MVSKLGWVIAGLSREEWGWGEGGVGLGVGKAVQCVCLTAERVL